MQSIILLAQTYRAHRNLTLIVSGPTVAGRTGIGEHFLLKLFKVWARLVPINTSIKTESGTNYK